MDGKYNHLELVNPKNMDWQPLQAGLNPSLKSVGYQCKDMGESDYNFLMYLLREYPKLERVSIETDVDQWWHYELFKACKCNIVLAVKEASTELYRLVDYGANVFTMDSGVRVVVSKCPQQVSVSLGVSHGASHWTHVIIEKLAPYVTKLVLGVYDDTGGAMERALENFTKVNDLTLLIAVNSRAVHQAAINMLRRNPLRRVTLTNNIDYIAVPLLTALEGSAVQRLQTWCTDEDAIVSVINKTPSLSSVGVFLDSMPLTDRLMRTLWKVRDIDPIGPPIETWMHMYDNRMKILILLIGRDLLPHRYTASTLRVLLNMRDLTMLMGECFYGKGY
jgi:hypothetical protein